MRFLQQKFCSTCWQIMNWFFAGVMCMKRRSLIVWTKCIEPNAPWIALISQWNQFVEVMAISTKMNVNWRNWLVGKFVSNEYPRFAFKCKCSLKNFSADCLLASDGKINHCNNSLFDRYISYRNFCNDCLTFLEARLLPKMPFRNCFPIH